MNAGELALIDPADHYSIITARTGDTIASSVDDEGESYEEPHADFGKDAEFIAHAREDIPALLAVLRERDNTIARVRAAVASAALKVLADFDTVMNVKGEVAYIVAEYNRALRAALDPQETE